jgi:hypothetical protein
MTHKTSIITTKLFGTWYQPECSCGWLAPRSYSTKQEAQKHAAQHVEDAS